MGMIVQPLIGRLSDGRGASGGFFFCRRFGRRRPFLALAGVALLLAQLMVGNSADLGHLLGDGLHDDLRIRAVLIFTLGFWMLDASNNAIWVVSKSLTADVVPEAQWPEAFSVSTAATGLGLALGYLLGGVHWAARMPGLKTTACNDAGGCADLRFAFLLACCACVLANLCTLVVAKETIQEACENGSGGPGDVHTPLIEGERSCLSVLKVVAQKQALCCTYMVTLLAWLGWISLQMYQTEFVAKEVFGGSPDPRAPSNKEYVDGVQAASRALVVNAVLMTATTYLIPSAIHVMGKARLWCAATLLTSLLMASTLLIRKNHAKLGASFWLAMLGPAYGVQQTIPFIVVSEEAPKDLLGELNGYLNVSLCIPQLLVSLFGGSLSAAAGSDTILFGMGAILDLVAAAVCVTYLR
ncbi:unnamed protein product [Effrenium voratum]|uniref:Sucrose transporter n=1 Tax=Effrenium voratum TaxID=2562239 RepID=A0AA36MSZ3_9DINO|nr:unnamed protein product [Effrenium voratum]